MSGERQPFAKTPTHRQEGGTAVVRNMGSRLAALGALPVKTGNNCGLFTGSLNLNSRL